MKYSRARARPMRLALLPVRRRGITADESRGLHCIGPATAMLTLESAAAGRRFVAIGASAHWPTGAACGRFRATGGAWRG
jgi:hypothetical protein